MAERTEEYLRLFRNMVTCCYDLTFWAYDSHMNLIHSTSETPKELQFFFAFERERFDALREEMRENKPVVLSNPLGMAWIACFELDPMGELLYTHLMGPAFVEDVTAQNIEAALIQMRLSPASRQSFSALLEKLPVISFPRFLEYGQMMHYCVTEEKCSISEFHYVSAARKSFESSATAHASWAEEQQMLKLMEEGNLDYKRFASGLMDAGILGNSSTIRQVKNVTIVHTALCTRAAIRGGLSPEIAYTLSDHYINSIEACRVMSDIAEVNDAMQDDFVHRVHRCRTEGGVSPQIQKCCDYIQLNLSRTIPMDELANWAGYSKSHLGKKFRAETGQTIKEYTMTCRIERAKQMLISSKDSVQEICEYLGFGSQSYFGEQFRKATGMTPMEYRSKRPE